MGSLLVLRMLNSLPSRKEPIKSRNCVICCLGEYRTGKTFVGGLKNCRS